MRIFVDSDNAAGSPAGDVDDAFALAALIRGRAPIAGLSACAGNTSAALALANNRRLAEVLGWSGPLLDDDEGSREMSAFEGRILALGPLTNVTRAIAASEIVIVGGNASSRGRWPPVWPFEFNLTKDRAATLQVFHSGLSLTVFPLDVARTLTATREDLEAIPGEAGRYLRAAAGRWFDHLMRVRHTRHFPIYDLAPALYALGDDGFEWRDETATMNSWTAFRFGAGHRRIRLCTALDRDALWARFLRVMSNG